MLTWPWHWTWRDDLGKFLRRAWSFKLHIIGGLIQGVNLYWIAFVDKIPAVPFFVAGLLFNVAGVIASTIHQNNMHDDDNGT